MFKKIIGEEVFSARSRLVDLRPYLWPWRSTLLVPCSELSLVAVFKRSSYSFWRFTDCIYILVPLACFQNRAL